MINFDSKNNRVSLENFFNEEGYHIILLQNINPNEITLDTDLQIKYDTDDVLYTRGIHNLLKKDALSLCKRLSKEGNDSQYKMLINNLKTTMELIEYLEYNKINSHI